MNGDDRVARLLLYGVRDPENFPYGDCSVYIRAEVYFQTIVVMEKNLHIPLKSSFKKGKGFLWKSPYPFLSESQNIQHTASPFPYLILYYETHKTAINSYHRAIIS